MELVFDEQELAAALFASCGDDLVAAAERVAAKIRAETGAEVSVKLGPNRRGRPVATIMVKDPAALRRQAKHGTLTRAAAECGLHTTRARPK